MKSRLLISIAFCIVIFGLIFCGYNFMIKDFPSKEEAREIADLKFRKDVQENDPLFESWRQATIGEPALVRTLDEVPSYWRVPVIYKEKMAGFIDVKSDRTIPRYGMFCQKPDNLSECPSMITTPEEAFEVVKNTTEKYRGANISAPILVQDEERNRIAWMMKVEKDGKNISRVFVVPSGFVYERLEGEIYNNVGGFDIAFKENISEYEIKSILRGYNLISPYELKYNVTYIHPLFYGVVLEKDFEKIKNILEKKEVFLTKSSKKENQQIIVMIDSFLHEKELIPIVESYNIKLKRVVWVYIDYNGSDISEKDGNTLKEYLEKNEEVIYAYLDTRACC